MKKWWQKSLMIAVALATFGAITPNHTIWENFLDHKNPVKSASAEEANSYEQVSWTDPAEYWVTNDTILENIRHSAEEQAYIKFGSRIGPVIGEEFQASILPKLQQAIDETLSPLETGHLRKLAVTEKPAGDHAEKIFHVYNTENGKDVLRFHVRTEKKPLEGYSFNFHYHVAEDQFQSHRTIGDIYWSKNTPPKWLS